MDAIDGATLGGEDGSSPQAPKSIDSLLELSDALTSLPDPLPGNLIKGRILSNGGYGDCYEGVWTHSDRDDVEVVIKSLRIPYWQSRGTGQIEKAKIFKNTVLIWNSIYHRNILPFCGWKVIDGEPSLVSPLIRNGNLSEFLHQHNLTDTQKLKLILDAAHGLEYLHSLNPPIAHGDIRPTNVLVTEDTRGVLCGFTNSRVVGAGDVHVTRDFFTPFSAKELFDEYSAPTPMSDVYAFGGLILEVMSRRPPFYRKFPAAAIILAIFQDQMPDPIDHPDLPETSPLWDLMRRCWHGKPECRPNLTQIVNEVRG